MVATERLIGDRLFWIPAQPTTDSLLEHDQLSLTESGTLGRRDRSVAEREHLAHRFAAELVAMRVTAAADSPGPDLVDQRSFAQRQLDWLAAGTERFWWFRTAGPIPQQVV